MCRPTVFPPSVSGHNCSALCFLEIHHIKQSWMSATADAAKPTPLLVCVIIINVFFLEKGLTLKILTSLFVIMCSVARSKYEGIILLL